MKPKQLARFEKEMRKGRQTYKQEENYNWLTPLLDAYQIVDAGAAMLLQSKIKTSNRSVACREGCWYCCSKPDIPINPVELMGLSWYASEILTGEKRSTLEQQLLNYSNKTTTCPFLINNRCSVYPVRPIACRSFYVFDTPCAPDEDIIETRPQDIAKVNNKEIAWMVAEKLLPLFGVLDKKLQQKQFSAGYLSQHTKSIQDLDWSEVAKAMKEVQETVNAEI